MPSDIPRFRAAAAEAALEPIRFSVVVPDPAAEGGERDEHFSIARPVPVVAFVDLALAEQDAEQVPDSVVQARKVAASSARFLSALLGDEYPRFLAATTEARWGFGDLVACVAYVVEANSGLPTMPSSPGSSSSPATGGSSTDGAESVDGRQPNDPPSTS